MDPIRTSVSLSLFLALGGCAQAPRTAAETREAERDRTAEELAGAAQVVAQMTQIPARQRARARCVVVVPSLVRAGFVVGARHGDGVASCRASAGWSAPAFVTIAGGSAGFQIGVESSDLVMLVTSERGMNQLLRTRFAIGADASTAAGPVGEATEAGTDASMTAEILSYARSRGLFAGVELSGGAVKQDRDALVGTYGESADVRAVLAGEVAAPKSAAGFLEQMASAFPPARVSSLGP